MQLQGVLDQLFCYSGPLGAEVGASGVAVRVWAPTAQKVCLIHMDGSPACDTSAMDAISQALTSASGKADE